VGEEASMHKLPESPIVPTVLSDHVSRGSSFGVEATQVRLNQTGGLTAGPILEKANVSWRDIGKPNEDALHR
jgi:hypothetical protein